MDESKFQVWKKISIGILISVPVLFVVLGLLISADAQFERMIGGIPQWIQLIDGEVVFRIIVVLFYTFAFFGLMQALFKKQINAIMSNGEKQTFQIGFDYYHYCSWC